MNKNLISIQQHINSIKTGYCLLIKLINTDELSAMYGHEEAIIIELYKIVEKVCTLKKGAFIVQIGHNKIMIVLPFMDKDDLKKLSYKIYAASQLYRNEKLSSAYINCHIASIDFPKSSNKAFEIHTLLNSRISSFKQSGYYYEYDENLHNIDKIKEINQELNFLRKAITSNSLKFVYQPIIESNTGTISYYECLLRFTNSQNKLISIGPIIHDAENKGLINVIDHIALEMVIKELNQDKSIQLSVNISNISIIDDHLLIYAKELLTKYQVSDRLIIEITETALNQDYLKTRLFMKKLNEVGCRFALDDFGSGFTSFKQLKDLPIDIIKIDGSYIRDIINNYPSKYFVEALIKMSEDLGIKTVAEFVENGEIAKFLIDIKIDAMQGDFFSPAKEKRLC